MVRRSSVNWPINWVALALMAIGCSRPVQRPDGSVGLLPVGGIAPEVVGADVSGSEVKLSAQHGKGTVVFFYPMDASPGCTKEVCGFRGAWKQFQDANLAVIGVSSDSKESHQKWLTEQKLPFALASDPNGDVARSYGVGKKLWGYDRVTFLVGSDGKVAKVWPAVDPAQHFNEVLAAAAELK